MERGLERGLDINDIVEDEPVGVADGEVEADADADDSDDDCDKRDDADTDVAFNAFDIAGHDKLAKVDVVEDESEFDAEVKDKFEVELPA